MKAIKLAHPTPGSRHDVTSWNNRIIVVGIDKKKGCFVLDAYDPVKAEFIETMGILGSYRPIAYNTVGRYLYILTDNLHMMKIDLETGKLIVKRKVLQGSMIMVHISMVIMTLLH